MDIGQHLIEAALDDETGERLLRYTTETGSGVRNSLGMLASANIKSSRERPDRLVRSGLSPGASPHLVPPRGWGGGVNEDLQSNGNRCHCVRQGNLGAATD